MGTDIYTFVEKKVKGKWEDWSQEGEIYDGRNYKLFSYLADVRNYDNIEHLESRGLPDDVSDFVKESAYDSYSASWLSFNEILNFKDKKIKVTGMKDKDDLKLFRAELEKENPNYDLLYPYCRDTNVETHEHFEVILPLSYCISDFILRVNEWIAENISKDYIGDMNKEIFDDYRLVFWFDC